MAWHPFRNLGLKAIALALGSVLWFTVSGHEIERRISVPVSYRNVPGPLELTGDQIDHVSVHVRGDDNIVSSLNEGSLRVVVDLASSQPGANIIPLRTDQVASPAGVEVMQIDPGTVTVSLERAGQLAVPVRPTIEGQPAPGFIVGEITVEPSAVLVAGPESRLTGTVIVVTERVLLEGRNSRVVQDVGVGVTDAQLRVHSPHTVRVTVQIEPAKAPGATGSAIGAAPAPFIAMRDR
jgi:YbbR domain-containing protein